MCGRARFAHRGGEAVLADSPERHAAETRRLISIPTAPPSNGGVLHDVVNLAATEREHILRALRESQGKISGPDGAAARLGLKRTTLQSKLKQMGIDRRGVDGD